MGGVSGELNPHALRPFGDYVQGRCHMSQDSWAAIYDFLLAYEEGFEKQYSKIILLFQ